jgi:MFS family permease
MKKCDRGKLWNLNFFLLWQGQFVSKIGDVMYGIALGFWVLLMTDSTALMGTIMAVTALPKIFLSPFLGVFVDRISRKKIIICMDVIRGFLIILLGIFSIFGLIQIWMLYLTGIILGICSAFFNPAIKSTLPDIVPNSKLLKANSTYSLTDSISMIFGYSVGGFLFNILGASIIFLVNGISFLFSSISEIFINIPKIIPKDKKFAYLTELKSGFIFILNKKGLTFLISFCIAMNFFGIIGITLILPYCKRYQYLGVTKYGILMAFLSIGLLAGHLLMSMIKIAPKNRFFIFCLTIFLCCISIIMFPFISFFPILAILMSIYGVCGAFNGVILQTVFQFVTPQEIRGKVFSLLQSLLTATAPIGFACCGIIAEFISLKALISGSWVIMLLLFIPILFSNSLKQLLNIEPTNLAN